MLQGRAAFIGKPVQPEIVLATVKRVLTQTRLSNLFASVSPMFPFLLGLLEDRITPTSRTLADRAIPLFHGCDEAMITICTPVRQNLEIAQSTLAQISAMGPVHVLTVALRTP
jgi:hypothetical protein